MPEDTPPPKGGKAWTDPVANFYPTMSEDAPPPKGGKAFQEPTPADKVAAVLYPDPQPLPPANVPPHIAELRKADADRAFFTEPPVSASAVASYLEAAKGHVPDEQIAAAALELREIAADLDFTDADVTHVLDLARAARSEPLTPELHERWHQQAADALQRQYGTDAPRALDLARQLAKRDPRVLRMLNESGLGSHPDVVLRFAEKARALQARGRL
jgi:hypothetical protein